MHIIIHIRTIATGNETFLFPEEYFYYKYALTAHYFVRLYNIRLRVTQ